ncbi:MAG TPA: hypothetical protein VM912_05880, partial [Terriglobales bacterium]|nr:hypothetical protein [Terriglobales bacterium]
MSAAPACPHFNSSSSAHAWPSTRQIIEKIVFISCTELPPNLLLMAKLVVLCVLLNRHLPLSSHFLPFLPIFDRLGTPAAFHWVLTGVFGVAALALFLNFRVRTACLILGLSLFVSVLASRSYFSNNLVYCGCLLLLTGLHQPGREPWPLRFQVALLYFGAGLNKALDIDWRSGQFFEHWFGYVHHHLIYVRIASLAPPLLLSQVMSWAAIATEFFLAAAFLVRRLFPYAIWLGLLY